MDGQTPGDSKDRAYAQRRAVKTVKRTCMLQWLKWFCEAGGWLT